MAGIMASAADQVVEEGGDTDPRPDRRDDGARLHHLRITRAAHRHGVIGIGIGGEITMEGIGLDRTLAMVEGEEEEGIEDVRIRAR